MPIMTDILRFKSRPTVYVSDLEKSNEDFIMVASTRTKNQHFVVLKPETLSSLYSLVDPIKAKRIDDMLKEANDVVSTRSKHLNA